MENLPTLAELHHDVQAAFKNDQLNLLLNQPPHESWLKDFPAEMGIKSGGKYMPIDKVQFMLTRIFGEWYPQVVSYTELFQSIAVHVRLHYKNPLTGEWAYKDGVGACPVQTDKGESAANLGAIKNRAVQIALPIAKSAAVKDAAEELGTLFGRDLNRKDTLQFVGAYGDGAEQKQKETTTEAMTRRYRESHAYPAIDTLQPGQLAAKPAPPIQTAIQQPSATPSFTFNPTEL